MASDIAATNRLQSQLQLYSWPVRQLIWCANGANGANVQCFIHISTLSFPNNLRFNVATEVVQILNFISAEMYKDTETAFGQSLCPGTH